VLGSAKLMAFAGVRDLTVARAFYGDVLGLRIIDENPFAVVADVGGTMLRITAVERPAEVPYTVLGWEVPDIAATVRDLAGRGVEFITYDGMGQDELGVWTAPGGARIAWFRDPDRNTLSLTEFPDGG
jgi:catechol 2,3-dioxygenase-like lactoylglutathione lyase family enzyme